MQKKTKVAIIKQADLIFTENSNKGSFSNRVNIAGERRVDVLIVICF